MQHYQRIKSPEKYFALFLFAFLFIYLILRIIKVDMTVDESASALMCIDSPFMKILSFDCIVAGNHWLNSVLIYLFAHWFGIGQAFIRLPNTLIFSVYFLFCYKILRQLSQNPVFTISGLIILCVNAYLLDFFSLARGYGLSVAFMAGSVYYLLMLYQTQLLRYLHYLLIFAFLSVLSNFVMLNFLVTMLAALTWLVILLLTRKEYRKTVYTLLITVAYLIILTLVIYRPVHELKIQNQLYWGGVNGFWKDTVHSLISQILYNGWGMVQVVTIVILLIISVTGIISLIFIIQNKKRHKDRLLFLAGLTMIILPGLSIVLQNKLLGTPFLFMRTGLFLWPLSLFGWLFFAGYWFERDWSKKAISILMVSVSVILAVHGSTTFNLYKAQDWQADIDNRTLISDLKSYARQNNTHQPIILGVRNIHFYQLSYYNRFQSEQWFSPEIIPGKPDKVSFCYFTDEWHNQMDSAGYTILKQYPRSHTALYRSDKQ
ncbi:MAG: hypothetical protein NTU44_14095 [Bacteroidetes bacterium]|nr:hypothetical protein [Bacteroidota bacterium]